MVSAWSIFMILGIVILNMLILPIYEHKIPFHFFMSSLITFNDVFYFSLCRSFTTLVNFVHRYFLLFIVITKQIENIMLNKVNQIKSIFKFDVFQHFLHSIFPLLLCYSNLNPTTNVPNCCLCLYHNSIQYILQDMNRL